MLPFSVRATLGGLCWCLLCSPLIAQDVRRVTLAEAVSLFAQASPALTAARADAVRSTQAARQAAALSNPLVDVTHENLSGGGLTAAESYVTVRQRLPFPWVYAAERRAAAEVGGAAVALVAAEEAELRFGVREAYLEAAFAEAAHTAVAAALVDVRRAVRDAERREADGDLSGYALRRLQVERARYELDLAERAAQVERARRTLAVRVTADSVTLLAPSGFPPSAPTAPIARPSGHESPLLAAARAQVRTARGEAGAVSAGRWPDLSLLGGFKTQADGLRGLYVGVGMPLPLFDRRGSAMAAATAGVTAAEARLAIAHQQAQGDEASARAALAAQIALAATLMREIPLDPDHLVAAARVGYAEGELSLVEFLDAIEAARTARMLSARQQRDLWMARFDLERVLGLDASDGER